MQQGPEACGMARPTWSAGLLDRYLAERTGIAPGERTARRGLASLGYRLGRPTWSVRHKAEEESVSPAAQRAPEAGVEALVSAAAEAPRPPSRGLPPPALPPVLQEVVDSDDEAAVQWLCDLLTTGRAGLCAQD